VQRSLDSPRCKTASRHDMSAGSQPPRTDEVVVIVTFFDIGSPPGYEPLRDLTSAINGAGIPPRTPIYAGTYGANAATADAVMTLPRGRYAPLFAIQPRTSRRHYDGRHLRTEASADPAYAGRIPISGSDPLPIGDWYKWGRELGRRFRDALATSRERFPVETWQFDEILLEAEVGARQAAYREYMTGILDGLYYGRPELGDIEEQGIVWYAIKPESTLPTRHVRKTPWLEDFWIALDRASFRLAGEEFPRFEGKPDAAASSWAEFQRLLRRHAPLGGDIRRSLGEKYVLGMSPGYRKRSSLGGNVGNWPRGQVNRWRNSFVKRRTQITPLAGYAQFNFTKENASPQLMRDALTAVSTGVRWNPKARR
jgi:hypothetical protein